MRLSILTMRNYPRLRRDNQAPVGKNLRAGTYGKDRRRGGVAGKP
jgi:hypothetical protein